MTCTARWCPERQLYRLTALAVPKPQTPATSAPTSKTFKGEFHMITFIFIESH